MWISPNCCSPSLFIYLEAEWNWLHTFFQLWQLFSQIRGLVLTSISWASLQAQIFSLTSSLSGTRFEAPKWWKIIQIKTAAEAQNRNLHDLVYHIWDAVQKYLFSHRCQQCTPHHQCCSGWKYPSSSHSSVTWLVKSESELFLNSRDVLVSPHYHSH